MEAALGMLVQVLVPLGTMAMIVLIVWFSHESKRKAKARQAEIVSQLIDKFSTGEAFAAAIQGPEGSRLAEALALEGADPPKQTWKGLFIPASVLTSLGIAFLILAGVRDDDLLIPALVIGSVGLGVALAAYVLWRVEQRNGDGSSNGEGNEVKTTDAPGNAGTTAS